MATNFSLEDDAKLIDMVQEREHLYNISDENYKNFQMRKDSWIDISKMIGKPGWYSMFFISRQIFFDAFKRIIIAKKHTKCLNLLFFVDSDCLKRWTTIKDYYNRVKRKKKWGSTPNVKRRMARLSFLDGASSLRPR